MKEIEKLIEAARALAHHHATLSSPDTRWGKKEYEDVRNSITAAEAMLKRAKVFEFEPKNITTSLNNDSAIAMQKEARKWHDAGIPFKLILIPEADNGK